MGSRTSYRTLLPKRAPFQIGVDWWSHLRKVPRRRWISHTYPVWLWGCSSCKISSPGPVLHGTKWLLWRPHMQSPTLHSRCWINKGLIKRGKHNRSLKVAVQGLDFMAHHFYIHTYIHIHTTFHKIWFRHSKVLRGALHIQTHRQKGDLMNLLSFFKYKESRIKTETITITR
jgi:hypothetical protein